MESDILSFPAKETGHVIYKLEIQKMKHMQKFKFIRCVLTGTGKCDTKIRRRTVIVKDVFQKLRKVLRHRSIPLESKKRVELSVLRVNGGYFPRR